MRAIFTFRTGAQNVWWLLITSVQCISGISGPARAIVLVYVYKSSINAEVEVSSGAAFTVNLEIFERILISRIA